MSEYRTRTYIFTIKHTDAPIIWSQLCETERNYDYLCMNIKRKTISRQT
jgi:hypothetical protein